MVTGQQVRVQEVTNTEQDPRCLASDYISAICEESEYETSLSDVVKGTRYKAIYSIQTLTKISSIM